MIMEEERFMGEINLSPWWQWIVAIEFSEKKLSLSGWPMLEAQLKDRGDC